MRTLDRRSKSWAGITISQEIAKLKEKNVELLDRLKSINEDLNQKLAHQRTRSGPKPVEDPVERHEKIVAELRCQRRMFRVYRRELDILHAKTSVPTGLDRIAELDRKVTDIQSLNSDLLRRKRTLEQTIRGEDRSFVLNMQRDEKEVVTIQLEVSPTLAHP